MQYKCVQFASILLAALALIGLGTRSPGSSLGQPAPGLYQSNAPDDDGSSPEAILREAGVELTVAALSAVVGDPEEPTELRYWAALALGRSGDTAAAPALVDALRSPPLDVRYGAVVALGELGSARSVKALATVLSDDDSRVRAVAVQALARIGGPEALALLASKLRDAAESEAGVRMQAAFELGRLGGPAAIEALEAALADGAAEVRAVAAVALADHTRPAAVPTLVEVALSPLTEEWLRLDAIEGLEKLSHQSFGYVKRYGAVATGPERAAAMQLLESWWQNNQHKYLSP